MAEPDEYFLGYRQAEQERLQRQAQELAQEARWLLALIEERELDESMAALKRHIEDPRTLVVFSLYFQAWGRKAEQ